MIVKYLQDYTYTFTKNNIETTKTVKWYWAMTDYIQDQVLIVGTTESEKKTQKSTKWISVKQAIVELREDEDKKILSLILEQLKD